MKLLPSTPHSLLSAKHQAPEFVVEAFNKLLQLKFDGTKAVITQEEAVRMLVLKMRFSRSNIIGTVKAQEEYCREKIFQHKYLDIEPLYEKFGWKVSYDPDKLEYTFLPQ